MSDILSQIVFFIVPMIFLMGIVITIHELGHYYAGRYFGAAVESFSIGFGKSIYEKRDKRGTRWRINRFPLGGFVKFIGENQTARDIGADEFREPEIVGKAFTDIGPGQRSAIAIAGPLANFILAVGLFALILMSNGKDVFSLSVSSVEEGSPAAAAGFEAGDKLMTIWGKTVEAPNDLYIPMRLGTGNNVPVTVERDGMLLDLSVTPVRELVKTGVGTQARMGRIGLAPQTEYLYTRSYNPVTAIWGGAGDTWDTTSVTMTMLGRIITGKESIHNLSGPVGIGDVGRRITNNTLGVERVPFSQRFWAFMWSMVHICALVSIGIGLFNLLPLPVLDGGHLVFNAYEAVTGKVMPERVVEYSLRFGLVLLLTMAVFVTYGDIIETGVFGTEGGSQP